MCAGLRDLRGFNLVLGGIKKLFVRVTEYWLNAVNIKSAEGLLNACESDKTLFSFAALFLVF